VAVRSKSTVPEVLTGEVITEPVVLPSRGQVPQGFHLVWNIIKTVLFFILRMLRPVLRIVVAIVSGFCFLVAITLLILAWFHGWAGSFVLGAAGFFGGALICSALTWYYDVLLLKLTPEGYELTLWS